MTQLEDIYTQAYSYLKQQLSAGDYSDSPASILRKEFGYYVTNKPNSLNGVYRRMLLSLLNRQGFPNFIGIDSVDGMSGILFDFDCHRACEEYGDDFERLFGLLKTQFPEKSIDIERKRSAWYQFTRGIISASKFLSNFRDMKEFDDFVNSFSFNEYAVAALPMLLEKEIYGFGFALACDFLKEVGYMNYGKPDVHLIDIFEGIGIVQSRSDFETFKTIVRIAREVGEEPVIVDKLFWILGSGKLERSGLSIGRQKKQFIEYYLKQSKQEVSHVN